MNEATEEDMAMQTKIDPRSLDQVHLDIGLANQYRLELIKHTMSISAAVFVFSVAFIKDYLGEKRPTDVWALGLAWSSMALSLVGGLGVMGTWIRFYISYRKDFHESASGEGNKTRSSINRLRAIVMAAQFGGFGAGLALLVFFCWRNM